MTKPSSKQKPNAQPKNPAKEVISEERNQNRKNNLHHQRKL